MLVFLLITNLLSLMTAYVYFRRNADAGVLIRDYLSITDANRILAQAAEKAFDANCMHNRNRQFFQDYWNNRCTDRTFEPSRVWLRDSKSTAVTLHQEFQSVRRTLKRNHVTAPTGLGEHPQMYLSLKQKAS
jgi:hypothetical protein